MKVEKVINNNIVRSYNDKDQEVLVMGKGLGFKKVQGDDIDEALIEKIYRIEQDAAQQHLEQLLAQTPLEHIQVTNAIISYAKEALGKALSDNLYTTLLDHISFAMQRFDEGLPIHNALLWEIKRFYQPEYSVGVHALTMIDEKLGIQLPEDEAGFIAMHLANATLNADDQGITQQTMIIIQDVLNIIKFHFQVDIKEDSIHYERLITHLKFFIHRLFSGNAIKSDELEFMAMIKKQYAQEYACSLKLYEYFLKNYNIQLSNDEMVYLTIHIRRVTSE